MLDPVSILNVVSFALQCSELIVEGAALTRHSARLASREKFEPTIEQYKIDLRLCLLDLENWAHTWGFRESPPRYKDKTLRSFWGEKNYQTIQRLLENISNKANHIEGILTGKSTPLNFSEQLSAEDWKRWSGYKKIADKIDNTLADDLALKYSTYLRKFAFALFQNKKLKEDIADLRKSVTQLIQDSETTYKLRCGRLTDAKISPEDIAKTEKLRDLIERLTLFARGLYKRSQDLGIQWSLELRAPDDYGSADEWYYLNHINLDFTLHDHQKLSQYDTEDAVCRSIRIRFAPDVDCDKQLNKIMNDIQKFRSGDFKAEYAVSDVNQVVPLGDCIRMSKSLRSLFWDEQLQAHHIAKAWELDRARLLLAFTNWIIFLLNTDWMDHACCCQLRFQKFKDRPLQFVHFGFPDNCQNSDAKGRKLLLLGLGLAEIILRRPLQIPTQNFSLSIVSDRVIEFEQPVIPNGFVSGKSPRWQKVSQQQIIWDIKKASSVEMAEAVEYCFEKSTLPESDGQWAHVTKELVSKVLQPVRLYVKIIEEQRKIFSFTKWWSSLLTYWPVESCFDPSISCLPAMKQKALAMDWECMPGAFPKLEIEV